MITMSSGMLIRKRGEEGVWVRAWGRAALDYRETAVWRVVPTAFAYGAVLSRGFHVLGQECAPGCAVNASPWQSGHVMVFINKL